MSTGENLGPLTTSPTLASACLDELNLIYKIHTYPGYYLLNGPLEVTSCYPNGYAGVASQFYSPVSSCPYGFTPACSSINAIDTVSETIYTCCPTQFSYKCQTAASYSWEATLGCVLPVISTLTTTWTVIDIADGTTQTLTSSGLQGGMNAYSIQVRFQSSASITSTFSSTSSAAQSSTASSTASPSSSVITVTQTQSYTPSSVAAAGGSSSSGLTSGAAAGIGVGAFTLLLVVAGTIICLLRKRKRRQNHAYSSHLYDSNLSPTSKFTPVMSSAPQEVYEAPAREYDNSKIRHELDGAGPREIM